MATTKINITAVLEAGELAASAANKIASAKNGAEGIRGRIDGKILQRGNLGNRLRNVTAELASIENQVRRICQTAQNGAEAYYSADARVKVNGTR